MSGGGWLLAGLVLLGGAAAVESTGNEAAASASGIPAEYQRLYDQHGDRCSGLDWALLAAVGEAESDHGRSDLPGVASGENSAGAAGPMQFLSSTWAEVRTNHPEIGSSRYEAANAIPAAAAYLCAQGAANGDTEGALFAYNHSNSYVTTVQSQARA